LRAQASAWIAVAVVRDWRHAARATIGHEPSACSVIYGPAPRPRSKRGRQSVVAYAHLRQFVEPSAELVRVGQTPPAGAAGVQLPQRVMRPALSMEDKFKFPLQTTQEREEDDWGGGQWRPPPSHSDTILARRRPTRRPVRRRPEARLRSASQSRVLRLQDTKVAADLCRRGTVGCALRASECWRSLQRGTPADTTGHNMTSSVPPRPHVLARI